ncbi:MAG TPA: hypothetical protein VGK88_05985 [bacterium]|jgi:hypothetical protein
MTRSAALWGLFVASAYVAVALITSSVLPVRLLFDGEEVPIPYRWVVRPPNAVNASSDAPLPGTGQLLLPPAGTGGGAVSTGDGQATIIFVRGAIAPRAGETSATIRLTPLDARPLGRLPAGTEFDGNAYRIEGDYTVSKQPIVVRDTVTVILRHATLGVMVLRLTQGRWEPVEDSIHLPSFQVVASTDRLGVFAPALFVGQRSQRPGLPWTAAIVITAGAVLMTVQPIRRSRR